MGKVVKKLVKAKVYNPKGDGKYSTYTVDGAKALFDAEAMNAVGKDKVQPYNPEDEKK